MIPEPVIYGLLGAAVTICLIALAALSQWDKFNELVMDYVEHIYEPASYFATKDYAEKEERSGDAYWYWVACWRHLLGMHFHWLPEVRARVDSIHEHLAEKFSDVRMEASWPDREFWLKLLLWEVVLRDQDGRELTREPHFGRKIAPSPGWQRDRFLTNSAVCSLEIFNPRGQVVSTLNRPADLQ